jgi:Holliday junction DNA helicase RuvA
MALNILSGMPTAELIAALGAGNVARLVSITGVGKRTAERRVVELQDRVRKLGGAPPPDGREPSRTESEAVSALVNLGYRPPEAERAVRGALERGGGDLADVIRRALQKLSG